MDGLAHSLAAVKAVLAALPDVPVDADKTGGAGGGGEVGAAGLRPGVHLAGGVLLQKIAQPVGVVVVAVGEDGQVNLAQIDAQSLGVAGKRLGAACVQQDMVLPVLDVQGQAVLRGESAVLGGGVFYQNGYLHGRRSFHSMVWGRVRS